MIVAGVDGSRAGLEAVAWAAREARLRDVPLRVVHAMPRWVLENRTGHYQQVAAWMRDGARSVVEAGLDRARREEPKVTADSAFLPGDPRQALIEAARDAELLVLGNLGLGGIRGLLVGSVAYGVAGHAPCDVVIVRDLPSRPHAEVVVGVDCSDAMTKELGFAFAEAQLRGARLRAVHAWRWLEAGGGFMPVPDDFDDERAETRRLAETLAGWQERHPDVEVVREVVRGHPAEVLRQAAEHADLLVVGSHGHAEFAGLVFGSVSQAMVHHAPCPLAVIRTRR
ncbi:universal stress protein [Nonomuraea soli]|uniref:Nucleotide-binding universal stress UspA family protein n=1 Tax=Nonomuraea soli TaxID=1032476 RepID=A0A7W0CF67_9ACTN|nr:universal stress protein [Nonomuraea soli]MBA2890028.1 nucleotide-binding universal stress UspA family protein [Nonomuraea soli]